MTHDPLISALAIDPARHFASPVEVLTHTDLSVREKKLILTAWKFEAEQLAAATDENMGGGEKQSIDEVNNALLNLPQDDDPESDASDE